ncbi:MAG TPA: DUF222 domain-containing protein [Egibacteraceae bacterium]|nr:DUF222 domain-containing protein [Egibacteraceae bacterium]
MGELRSAVDGVLGQDPCELADVELAERLVELEREIARLTAAQLAALAAFDARGAYQADGCGSAASWLRKMARVAPGDAAARVRAARRLRDEQPHVAAALADGDISWPHARVLSEQIGRTAQRLRLRAGGQVDAIDAADEVVRSAEKLLVDAARTLDPRDTAKVARRWQHLVDPDGFDRDAEHAFHRRYLNVSATWGGMVRIDGELDAEGGQTVLSAIQSLAAPDRPTDPRLPGQRRADALVELSRRVLDTGALPQSGGEKPHITVAISLDALEGRLGHEPGELAKTGPISAETARRLACDAGITRIITGADSEPLDIGRRTRVIPSALRRALIHRDQGCAWHGCDMPPEWTDAHHITHWADGGPTSLHNLVLLCRRHHRAVHESGQPLPQPP